MLIGRSQVSKIVSLTSAEGKTCPDYVEIREEGRWVADTSLRVYLDIAATAQIETETRASNIQRDADASRAGVLSFLSVAALKASR